jgi:hypothetical protein
LSADRRLLALGALSGVLSYLGTTLLDAFPDWIRVSREAGAWLPGVFFGGLVLAPLAPAGPRQTLRQLACIGLSALIYRGAVHIAVFQTIELRFEEVYACALTGLLGALATAAAARYALPFSPSRRAWASAGLAGALGGAVLGVSGSYRLGNAVETAILIGGFVLWQAGVGVMLFSTRHSARD